MKKTTLRQAALKLAIVALVLLSPLGLRAQNQLNEGFEDSTFPPEDWTSIHVSGTNNWAKNTTYKHSGNASAYAHWANAGHENYFITPKLVPATGESLSFFVSAQSYSGTTLTVEVSTTNATAASFTTTLATYTTGSSGTIGTTSQSTWVEKTIDLSAYVGQEIYIAFHVIDDNGGDVYIDDVTGVSLYVPACAKPTGLAVENGVASWNAGTASQWNLKYKKVSDETWNSVNGITAASYTFPGLDAATNYEFQVQTDCGGGVLSDWTSSASFTTPCAEITTFPWNEDFTGLTSGIPNCWDNTDGTTTSASYKWSYFSTGHNGVGLRFNSYNNSNNNTNFLKTPVLNFPTGSVMQLVFWYKNPTGGDFSVYISTDGGATYTTALATGLTGQSTWKEKEINLTDYVGAENVVIVFKGTSNYGNGDAYIYLDDVTVRQAPSCLAPTGLAATPSTTSAELSWTANSSETAWTIYYKKTTDENYTEVSNVTTNPYTLSDLTPASNYQFYVVANCSANDASYPSEVFPFATACEAVTTFPWSENFDTYTAGNNVLPICWSYINTTTYSSYQGYPKVYNSSANSASNCLYLYSYAYYYSSGSTSYDPQPQYAILPEMDNLDGKQITLFAKGYNASSTLKVGRMTDPTDASTFTLCQELTLTTSYQEFEVELTGTGNYIALMIDAATSSRTTNSVYVDDITVENVPTCRKPSALMLETPSSRTAHTATLKWTNGEEGQTAWQIAYSTDANFDPYTVTPVDVTTNPATISGLENNNNNGQTYYAYVRANCDDDGYSAWNTTKATFATVAGNQNPTNLNVAENTVSSSSATATWTGATSNDLHESYDIYYSQLSTMPEELNQDSLFTGHDEATYTFENLTPSTEYFVWVQDNCGTDGESSWVGPANFTTQAACPTPVLNAITEFTAHTADVEWSNFTENTNYEVSYRTAAYFTGETEEFGTTMPTGWAQYTGLLNENGTATLSSSTYAWTFGSNNGVFNNHARVNIYDNNQRWLITSALTVPENGALTFDMALTAYSGTLAAPGTNGTDDKFVVLITTDEMATWTVLREWNNSGSEYVYNNIASTATGENVMIDLGEYVGQTVRIAFYGESTTSNADNNLHIDNVGVGVAVPAGEWQTQNVTENSLQLTNLVAETPYDVKVAGYCDAAVGGESNIQTFTTAVACPVPTGLAIVDDATANSVDLTWTAGAVNQNAWQICLNGDETNLLDVTDATVTGTTVTYTLTGLTSGADYSVKVRANCGDEDGVSQQWTDTVNFTTEASCTEPSTLAVVENSVQAHQVQLRWTAGGEEESWDIYYSEENVAPANGGDATVTGITDNPYILSGLTDARTYYVWVRAHCGNEAGEQSPWIGGVSFFTPQEAVTAPYADDFENGNNWLLVNGNLNNAWAYGEAVYNGGTHALYISNDGGATNAYNNGSAAMVYATKLITFEEGTYKFSYDWKANGESTYDYLRVALGPATTTLTAGTSVPTGFSTTTLPTGWTALDGGSKLNLKTDWQSYGSAEMPIAAGTYMMVFAWKNDGIGGSNPPAAIDNVSIEKITCIAPTALAASNVTAHAATLGWTAGADEEAWQIAYGTTADFDQDDVTPIDDVTENPYLFGNLTQSTHYYVYVRAKCGEDDYSNWSNMTDFNTISGKQMPTGLTVTDIASATATATWTGVTTNVLHESYDLYYSKLSSMPETLNEDSLFTGITETSFEFTGLTPETGYHVWVRDICGDDGESDWTSTSFTTLPSCPTPTELAATNITNNAATIRWTGSSDVDNYTVQYRVAEGMNVVFNEGFENYDNEEALEAVWTVLDLGDGSNTAELGLSSSAKKTGDYGFRFSSYSGSSSGSFDQYLISPELTQAGLLEFAYKSSNGTEDKFRVGYSSTTNDVDAFTWGDEIASASSWQTFSETMPEDAKYFAINYTAVYKYRLYIDDITISEMIPAGEWNDATEDVAAESFTIEGLEAETKYDVQVKSNCTNGEYSAPYPFTTASVFTKSIQANKWYAIATPAHDCVKPNDAVALTNVLNLTTADHDLYSYDEANGSWMAASDSLMTGTGYIYRSAADAELGFVGYANTGSVSVSVTYSTTTDPALKGFNLIGNPYPHTVAVRRDFYTLEPEGTWMAKTSGNTITAAEACLVQYTYSTTYTFRDETPTPSKSSSDHVALAFTVSNDEFEDVAYARFDNGEGLPKIGHLTAEAPMLSIPIEGRRYAIANLGSDCESFDLVFRGTGTYTLSFNGNTGYCHLIDRVAGKDIDMLRQNYTFSSNGFDADRFTVKLSPDAQENANGNFAYWNGNVWMVEGNGTLQVFDALGRQLFSQEISNSNFEIQNSLFPAAGVYVLRMGEKTQKIVVR